MKENYRIPQATTKRLPLYYRFIQSFSDAGKERISSKDLSEAMQIDSATIRRDFSYFGPLGKKGYGYDVQKLLVFFRGVLDQDQRMNVAVIGIGNLGHALLKYNFQKNHNMKIVVAFDTNYPKEGELVNGVPVFHPDVMEDKFVEYEAELPIMTVPARSAQIMADRLVSMGVKGALNFTPVRLQVPENFRVHTIDLSIELQTLSYFIRNVEE
ncbi:redox-sensing transcriptional repressor Rex [Kurthia zopfii]|uniref:Redox-sensing transcriptional repressor Rex n=1 Tax=Kurthia zopfii TaxID=1650 RepID=A0A2U3A9B1_9BACL|nr:redox-sensing transcriptional repressor Rex [Kurthia zopfii]PWI21095.1 redox-sensing transcriptional repressor Rex [Kurthia zopfii]TDR32420.1 redox-sensing transcriptional repressor [Kurthia zopfii]STX10848.1 Redox-sensing transcriptional repressor rex [Kurthia zopfii]VEI05779.1 Redox-sensing transcriptional repressor rex [Kurthia zopfii]GEK32351.1 redox-sensing transcriptional repressor Rex [Kurthia zopfii]